MPNNLITRLRAEANAIDDTDDIELRALLTGAADEMERVLFANRYNADMYNQMDEARKEALAEVGRLKAQNARLREAIEYSESYLIKNPMNVIAHKSKAHMEMRHVLKESPAQSLAEIQARAVEVLKDRWSQDLEERQVYTRFEILDALDHEISRLKPDRGGSGHDREVLGQNNEAFDCWSCRIAVTDSAIDEADGHCPHCGAEIDRDEEGAV